MSEETVQKSDIEVSIVGGDGINRTDYVMKIGGNEVEVTRQLFDDTFKYDEYKCMRPPYDLDALLYFFDNNTWHARCCRLKAACAVSLGFILRLIDGMPEDEQEYKRLQDFFKNCNPEETFSEILEKFMIDYEALGNAYLEIIRNMKGDIVNIYHIPAQTMRVRVDRDGYVQVRDVRYVYFKKFGDDRKMKTDGTEGATNLKEMATEVIHFSQYSPRSTYYGVPEWLGAASAMLGTEKAEDFNISFFENNAVPQFAVIVRKATLGQPVKDTIATFFRKEIKGKHHKTLVLEAPGEGEIDLKELATDPKEQSFRFYRLDNRDEVIAAHGVPPRMVGVISSGALGGKGDSDGQKEMFLSQIITPRQKRLNHRINKLLMGIGVQAKSYEFVLESLNPADDNADSERFERYIKIGVLTINEVRKALKRPVYKDMEGADEPFIFTSSGPILVSSLVEYMEMALMPDQPSPPGLPGGSGVTTDDDKDIKRKKKGKVQKFMSDLISANTELREEVKKLVSELEEARKSA